MCFEAVVLLSCSVGDGISGGVYQNEYMVMVFSFIQLSLIQLSAGM